MHKYVLQSFFFEEININRIRNQASTLKFNFKEILSENKATTDNKSKDGGFTEKKIYHDERERKNQNRSF